MKKLRIIFAGTPDFGLPCLESLYKSQEIIAVFTQPDRPAGRGRTLQASAVKTWALEHKLAVYQPNTLKDLQIIKVLEDLKPDVMVVIAYGLILPAAVLAIPKFGCINVHASLLPRWRGASPIQQAILAGDTKTGITIMQMDVGMDTGDILAQESCDILNYSSLDLQKALATLAVEPLLSTLSQVGALKPIKQNEALVTYAPKINKEDAKINWHKEAVVIDNLVKAYNPWPIAYTTFLGETLRIHKSSVQEGSHQYLPGTLIEANKDFLLIAAGKNFLRIEALQMPGGKILTPLQWLQNRKLPTNLVLGKAYE